MGRKPNLEKYQNIIIMKNNKCKQNEIKYKLRCSTETIGKALKYAEEHPNFMPQYTGLNIVKKNEQQRIEYYTALHILKESRDLFELFYSNCEITNFILLKELIDKITNFLKNKTFFFKIVK